MATIEIKNLFKIYGRNPQKAMKMLESGDSKEKIMNETGNTVGVNNVSFEVQEGETFVVMGLSGSGKSTLIRCLNRLIEPTQGSININGTDITKIDKNKLRAVRKEIQLIFQDPYSSLNPRMTILDIIAEPLLAHGAKRKDCEDKVSTLLTKVGLDPSHMRRFPHAFSGGQRQRIGIARALSMDPKLIVADEPVSALDVSVQAQILNLLNDLQEEFDLTFLFIAHDLSVIRYICDRVAVMYLGQLVEIAETKELYSNPLHPYTSGLISAVPEADPNYNWKYGAIKGEIGDPSKKQEGCSFKDRCDYSQKICSKKVPELQELKSNHQVACHFANDIELDGIKGVI